jgi:hypothetical protein
MVRPVVHAMERAAGRRHYLNFRRFLAGGGLRGILAERGLAADSRVLLYFHTIEAVRAPVPK